MSCQGEECTCGCCSGIAVMTPQSESNSPGLSAITYRTGTWATFKESMLARISSSDYPALAALKTRDDDDISIAFLDATATVLDILTFYQERLANESYLRTATQLSSLVQLSRLLGYQPSPGVAASTYLAFTLKAVTGQPANPGTQAITIPAGTQVQSVPGQNQTPQAFQTSDDILAKPDWNALPIQTGLPWRPKKGDTSMYLAGTATQLNPGDLLLIVGDERLEDPTSDVWDLCHVTSVQTDAPNQRTLVSWLEPLGKNTGGPSQKNASVFALRQRAALFGYNALNPILMYGTKAYNHLGSLLTNGDWSFGIAANSLPSDLASASLVDLDAVYSKVTAGGWLVLAANLQGSRKKYKAEEKVSGLLVGSEYRPPRGSRGQPAPTVAVDSLYYVQEIATISRSDYGGSAKITRATVDTNQELSTYYTEATRSAAVFTQSELLPVTEQPLDYPLYGTHVDLKVLRHDLVGVTAIALTGKNPKLTIHVPEISGTRGKVTFVPDDDTGGSVDLVEGQVLTLIQPPNTVISSEGSVPDWSDSGAQPSLSVADASGRTGTITTSLSNLQLTAPVASDPIVQEWALMASIAMVTENGVSHSRILLKTPLQNVYDRMSTSVNANVGAATAGSPVTEILGSGSASTPNQLFKLKQAPLTYVPAATPTGSESTLVVRANGAAWEAEATLYGSQPTDQVYTTLNLPGGATQVIFGDGVEGAMLPTGNSNIQAQYRVGTGSSGNVSAGTITTLVDRPVGVGGVVNPQAATGGADPQTVDGIRVNAPLSVLTLARAVSISDYQNFANSFAGIAKASAFWIPNGTYRGVFLTVAAADGSQLTQSSTTMQYLVQALKNYGNPNVAIQAASFIETTFGINANVAYDPAYDPNAVQAAILSLLQQTYNFANRTFGQGVMSDEIAALIQGVQGVVAVNVISLTPLYSSPAGDIGSAAYSIANYNAWKQQALPPGTLSRPCPNANNGIFPYVPVPSLTVLPYAAELLVLDPNPLNVTLGTMS